MLDDSPSAARNVALLIDADNSSADVLDPVLTVLAELGTVNIRRAYGNWSKQDLAGWAKIVHLHAIEPQQQFDVTKGKSATDMKLIIDAMDLLYGGRVNGFGIMSSDSDFMPLATRIRQDGIPVYGFGEAKTPVSFQNACTRFIDVGALRAAERPAPATARKAAKKTAATELAGQAVQAEPAPGRPIDAAVVKVLGDAWRAADRDAEGFASVKDVGKRAGNISSFDARSYGFANVTELLRAMPNFQVVQAPNGQVRVKRLN